MPNVLPLLMTFDLVSSIALNLLACFLVFMLINGKPVSLPEIILPGKKGRKKPGVLNRTEEDEIMLENSKKEKLEWASKD